MWPAAMRRALIWTAAVAVVTLVLQLDEHVHHQLLPVFGPAALVGVLGGWAAYRLQERRRARRLRQLRGA